MSSEKKDGKTLETGRAPPPTATTVVGVPSLPVYPPLDLDMEELSGSLLVEEPPGRGALLVASPSSIPVARLPKPTPPPKAPDPASGPNLPAAPPPHAEFAVARDTPDTAELPPADATLVEDSPSEDLPTLGPTQPALQAHSAHANVASLARGDVELATLPEGVSKADRGASESELQTAPLTPIAGDSPPEPTKRGASHLRREKLTLWIIALAGLVAGVGLVFLVVTAVRRHDRASHAPSALLGSAVSSAVASAAARTEPSAASPPATTASSPVAQATAMPACTVAGAPHVIAPNAVVSPGIEARAFGDDIALGFAPNEHQAMLVRLDVSSLTAAESSAVHSAEPIRRVTPIPGKKGRLGIAVDVDRKRDSLRWRRTLPLDPPMQVGVADGHVAWAPLGRAVAGKLWPLEGDDAVEALRGARSESNLAMVAIAFRRASGVWVGTAEGAGTLAPKTDLARVGSPGAMVGSPAIAVNEGIVLMAWAERRSPEDSWQLRWVRFKAGEAPGAEHAFTPPGGTGEQSMAPALAVAPGGRFLLVWTEGPASAHEVRALTLSDDGGPIGAPLRISGEGANAGQGQAAVTASGRGVVAFLESGGNGFQILATPITCGL